MNKKQIKNLCDLSALVAIVLLFLHYFPPELLLRSTQLVGGDTTAHYYYAWYLRHALLPQGKLLAWSNDLLMGYPVFQYYFPLPFLISAVLGTLIPFPIAMKLTVLACMLSIPFASYIFLRLLRLEFPAPALAALFSTTLMFGEKNRHMGFYVLDNLSGQFAGTLSFSLLLIFCGLLYRALEENKTTLGASFWLTAASLSHAMLAPTFAVLQSAFFPLFQKERLSSLKKISIPLCLGLSMFAFWALPFIWDTDFSVAPRIPKKTDLMFYLSFMDATATVVHLAALGGVWFALKSKDRRGLYLLYGGACLGLMLTVSIFRNYFGSLPVLDRYLPLYMLFASFLAAYGLTAWIRRRLSERALPLLLVGIAAAVFFRILTSAHTIPQWVRWNFSGLETKPAYPAFAEMTKTLRELPGQDRVSATLMYDSKTSPQLTGPFIWEILPMFTGKPAVATGTQGFYSLSFSAVQAYLYEGLLSRDPEKIDALCEIFDVRYILKSSATSIPNLATRFRLLREIPIHRYESFQIFERKKQRWHYVAVPEFLPVRYDGPLPKKEAIRSHLKDPKNASVPLVLSQDFPGLGTENPEKLPRTPSPDSCRITEDIQAERIRFITSCPQKPHMIRISYHPGWKAASGEKIYQTSPNFMLLYPQGERVELFYGSTRAGRWGKGLSIAGLLLAGYFFLKTQSTTSTNTPRTNKAKT